MDRHLTVDHYDYNTPIGPDEATSRLTRLPACHLARVSTVDDEMLDAVPAGGGWTLRQVVHHVSRVTGYPKVLSGTALIMATPDTSPTVRNLAGSGRVRLAIGATRDVVMVEGTVEVFSRDSVPAELAEAFAVRLWGARRGDVRFAYLRIAPQHIQAWREGNEITDRDLMREGRWLV
jgi:hypothetical protein